MVQIKILNTYLLVILHQRQSISTIGLPLLPVICSSFYKFIKILSLTINNLFNFSHFFILYVYGKIHYTGLFPEESYPKSFL